MITLCTEGRQPGVLGRLVTRTKALPRLLSQQSFEGGRSVVGEILSIIRGECVGLSGTCQTIYTRIPLTKHIGWLYTCEGKVINGLGKL